MRAELRTLARRCGLMVLIASFETQVLRAQDSTQSRISADTVAAADYFSGSGHGAGPALGVDSFVTVSLLPKVVVVLRPVVRRRSDGEWMTWLYQLGLRYQSQTRLPFRLEGGFLASPVGLGPFDTRADQNPTIARHQYYYAPLPSFERGTPPVQALTSGYPFGVQASVSSSHWDTRVALVDSTPTRTRSAFARTNPPRAPQLEAGAGYTPFAGARIGGYAAHGVYAREHEVSDRRRGDREATTVGVEWELAFRYTKLAGEWVRDSFEMARGRAIVRAWFVQGTETLSPRLLVAGRIEGTSSPALQQLGDLRLSSRSLEGVVGIRLTPDLTLRTGVLTSRRPGDDRWEPRVGASLVFARRWW